MCSTHSVASDSSSGGGISDILQTLGYRPRHGTHWNRIGRSPADYKPRHGTHWNRIGKKSAEEEVGSDELVDFDSAESYMESAVNDVAKKHFSNSKIFKT
jgi:hypothetical protein